LNATVPFASHLFQEGCYHPEACIWCKSILESEVVRSWNCHPLSGTVQDSKQVIVSLSRNLVLLPHTHLDSYIQPKSGGISNFCPPAESCRCGGCVRDDICIRGFGQRAIKASEALCIPTEVQTATRSNHGAAQTPREPRISTKEREFSTTAVCTPDLNNRATQGFRRPTTEPTLGPQMSTMEQEFSTAGAVCHTTHKHISLAISTKIIKRLDAGSQRHKRVTQRDLKVGFGVKYWRQIQGTME
jgi:hypothetical protein